MERGSHPSQVGQVRTRPTAAGPILSVFDAKFVVSEHFVATELSWFGSQMIDQSLAAPICIPHRLD